MKSQSKGFEPEKVLVQLATAAFTDCYVASYIALGLDFDDSLQKAMHECARDTQRIASRVQSEGLSFLTISLPRFCTDLESALEHGFIVKGSFAGFSKIKRSSVIPSFLRGILTIIFDMEGNLRNEVSIAVKAARQALQLFKKIRIDCSQERIDKAFEKYVQTDSQAFNTPPSHADIEKFDTVCGCLWDPCFVDLGVDHIRDLLPRHGPGATANGKRFNSKFVWDEWNDRLEPFFPVDAFCYSSPEIFSPAASYKAGKKTAQRVKFVGADEERPVRVISVPKTLKAPRIIAIEPAHMQYCQQSIANLIITRLNEYKLTRGHINFSDQTVNADLAMRGSIDRRWATIDLSEASDRVPNALSMRMFKLAPDLLGALQACRSQQADVPGHGVIRIQKFASMGSAVCFPVEAMYFYTCCVVGLLESRQLPPFPESVKMVCRDIFVYGDDIIVPSDEASSVIAALQKYYCKVGSDKTFYNGDFRESCGTDAFRGLNVTPIYIRSLPPIDTNEKSMSSLSAADRKKVRTFKKKEQSKCIVSWVKTANLMLKQGYWYTFEFMKTHIESILGVLPVLKPESEGLGWETDWAETGQRRFYRPHQTMQVKAPVFGLPWDKDPIDGYPALMKCLLSLERREGYIPTFRGRNVLSKDLTIEKRLDVIFGGFPKTDARHLERSPRIASSGYIKWKWVAA